MSTGCNDNHSCNKRLFSIGVSLSVISFSHIAYTVDRKSDTPLVFEFPLLLDAIYLQFFFTGISLSLQLTSFFVC